MMEELISLSRFDSLTSSGRPISRAAATINVGN